ncbi:MAG: hypothetical protein DI551_06890, partial [Micavibrio aeruginosavorus]
REFGKVSLVDADKMDKIETLSGYFLSQAKDDVAIVEKAVARGLTPVVQEGGLAEAFVREKGIGIVVDYKNPEKAAETIAPSLKLRY